MNGIDPLTEQLAHVRPFQRCGYVSRIGDACVEVTGLSRAVRIGDLVDIGTGEARHAGEVVAADAESTVVMTYDDDATPLIGERVLHVGAARIYPDASWAGRLIDAFGRPLDGQPLVSGDVEVRLRARPPDAAHRRRLGRRLNTSLAVTDTMLPIVRGQRVGIFAGSGVGKTTLLSQLANGVEADRVVIGLIGERGREVGEFVSNVLGPEGMARAVVVAATSDQSPLVKRRAAWTATAIAEVFRDQGDNVLLVLDSLTRFAEAHREVALTAGETPSLRAYPPSTGAMIASLTERSGTGIAGSGDITAIYSVLVAGSDMEEPVADIVRGLLDGHVVLDREIAERGRFPAIDVRRSISRSLPGAATARENEILARARAVLAAYEGAEVLIQTGLYTAGSDPAVDEAIGIWPQLDEFFARREMADASASFAELAAILGVDEPAANDPTTEGDRDRESAD